jgi:hypothetical protein
MSCLTKRFCSFLKKIVFCGSKTDLERDTKVDCKIDCCSTHNGTENTHIENKVETPIHKARSLRNTPVISRETSIIDTPLSQHRKLQLYVTENNNV